MRIRNIAAVAVAALALTPLAAQAVPVVGKPAPPIVLPTVDNNAKVNLTKLRGRPVYINFFASWCGPCNDEAAAIGMLRLKYAQSSLAVLGVDELEPRAAAAAFLKKYDNPYGTAVLDDTGVTGRMYGTIAMPVHVFVDRKGIVRAYRIGQMSPNDIEHAIKAILR